MNANGAAYSNTITDNPEMIEMCLNCKKENCNYGICNAYRDKYRELLGLPKGEPMPQLPNARSVLIEPVNGKYQAFGEWHSIVEWARLYGISRRALHNRIQSGRMTMEQCLTKPLRTLTRRAAVYRINGEVMTVKDIVARSGLSQSAIYYRLAKGLPIIEVADSKDRRVKQYEHDELR